FLYRGIAFLFRRSTFRSSAHYLLLVERLWALVLPQPPPPGVSIRRMSPALALNAHFPGSGVVFPLLTSSFLPRFPSNPPFRPYGPRSRRSLKIATCVAVSSSISRMIPSPPRNFPAPPEFFLMEKL